MPYRELFQAAKAFTGGAARSPVSLPVFWGTLAMGVFASVLATGHPIDLGAPEPVQVYSNF